MCNDGSITTIKYPLPTGSLLISQLLSRGCLTSNLLSVTHCAGVLAFIVLEFLLALRWQLSIYVLPSLLPLRWLLPRCHSDCGPALRREVLARVRTPTVIIRGVLNVACIHFLRTK